MNNKLLGCPLINLFCFMLCVGFVGYAIYGWHVGFIHIPSKGHNLNFRGDRLPFAAGSIICTGLYVWLIAAKVCAPDKYSAVIKYTGNTIAILAFLLLYITLFYENK